MHFGDSITDFPGLDPKQRLADPATFAKFGGSWFILPNTVYGSWQDNPHR